MTSTQGPNEFYVSLVQQQLDRRFSDLSRELDRRFTEMDRRFNDVDGDVKEIKTKIEKLEDVPKQNFRVYVTPIIVSLITAILLAFLVKQGVK